MTRFSVVRSSLENPVISCPYPTKIRIRSLLSTDLLNLATTSFHASVDDDEGEEERADESESTIVLRMRNWVLLPKRLLDAVTTCIQSVQYLIHHYFYI